MTLPPVPGESSGASFAPKSSPQSFGAVVESPKNSRLEQDSLPAFGTTETTLETEMAGLDYPMDPDEYEEPPRLDSYNSDEEAVGSSWKIHSSHEEEKGEGSWKFGAPPPVNFTIPESQPQEQDAI